MTNLGWIIAGGAAASGVIGMFWNYIKGLWGQLASRIIVSCELRGPLSTAVGMHFWQHYRTSRFGFRTYIGATAFVRPVKRVQVVGVEVVGTGGRLYWCGWLPVWLALLPTGDKDAIRVNNEYYWGGSKIVFLRGTLNLDKLLTDALAEYNHFQANSDGGGKTRYQIHHIFGTAGKPISLLGDMTKRDSELKATSDSNLTTQRTLQWKAGDLGASRMNHGNALAQMALSPEAQAMVEDVRHWLKSEDWHKARGIPWRRGWRCTAAPARARHPWSARSPKTSICPSTSLTWRPSSTTSCKSNGRRCSPASPAWPCSRTLTPFSRGARTRSAATSPSTAS